MNKAEDRGALSHAKGCGNVNFSPLTSTTVFARYFYVSVVSGGSGFVWYCCILWFKGVVTANILYKLQLVAFDFFCLLQMRQTVNEVHVLEIVVGSMRLLSFELVRISNDI